MQSLNEYLEQYDKAGRQQDAYEKIDAEIESLLESNGLGDFYYALTGTEAFENALKAEAKARNPELFH